MKKKAEEKEKRVENERKNLFLGKMEETERWGEGEERKREGV